MNKININFTLTSGGKVYRLKAGETYKEADVFEQGKYMPGWMVGYLVMIGVTEPVEPKGSK